MSALTRFLARHNIDNDRVASAAAGALLAVMAMTPPHGDGEGQIHKYFGNAPHQDIAQYDDYLLKTAAEIPDGSSTADLLEQLNWQKAQLVQANRHLETMKDSFLEGNKEMRKEAMFQLTQLLINYNAQHVTISFDEKPVAAGEDGVFHIDMSALRQELAQSAPGLK